MVSLSLNFLLEQVVFSHLIKGPRRTDGQNIIALTRAFLLVVIVGDKASGVGLHCAGAVSGEILNCDVRHR